MARNEESNISLGDLKDEGREVPSLAQILLVYFIDMNAFLFVLEVEPMKLGHVYEVLPLHCTLVHWFHTERNAEDILRAVKEKIEEHAPVTLTSQKAALFGREENIPVHTVHGEGLHLLHNDLVEILNTLTVTYSEPEFVGNGYKPHVTTHGEKTFTPGSITTVKNVYLVEAQNVESTAGKRPVTKISLCAK